MHLLFCPILVRNCEIWDAGNGVVVVGSQDTVTKTCVKQILYSMEANKQMVHLNGFSPVCSCMLPQAMSLVAHVYKQMVHLYGFSPVRVLMIFQSGTSGTLVGTQCVLI